MLPRWAVGCFVLLGVNLSASLPAWGADAKVLVERGHSWLSKGEYDRALDAFDEALRLGPQNGVAYGLRAVAYHEKGQTDRALIDLNEGLRRITGQKPRQASFLLGLRGNIWQAKGESAKALDDFNESLRLDPTNATTLAYRGVEKLRQDQVDAAMADFNAALRHDPKQVTAWVGRGRAWLDKQQEDLALADFTEAIRLNPKSSTAYFGRASVRAGRGDKEKALEDYNKALNLDPHDELALYGRGEFWLDQDELDKAIADLTEAIRLQPKMAGAYYKRGRAWQRKRDCPKAIEDFTLGLALRPEGTHVQASLVNRAMCNVELGQYDKALNDCNRALQLDPKSAHAYGVRGHAWSQQRQYEKAAADLAQSTRLDSKFAYGYRVMAWLQATCPDQGYRDGAQAVENATSAGRLNAGKEWRDYMTLAAAQAECGQFEAAVKWQTKALAMAESDTYARPKELAVMRQFLAAYQQRQPIRQLLTPGTP